jgi:hypothetical protein
MGRNVTPRSGPEIIESENFFVLVLSAAVLVLVIERGNDHGPERRFWNGRLIRMSALRPAGLMPSSSYHRKASSSDSLPC